MGIIKWLKIEWNYNACFATGKVPDVGHPAKGEINCYQSSKSIGPNDQPNPCQMKDQLNT
ncbi:hypothetical protein VP01_22g7 [Puccinia sorghi]|uniref:Uncharacterized protein n=1 Tax=Puccinia sorghi TaxID=27349 RepID=A0A0L6V7Z4_9BASI|nr:hypothetical protein VP01_22g7 [Puccinia sorghi]